MIDKGDVWTVVCEFGLVSMFCDGVGFQWSDSEFESTGRAPSSNLPLAEK